MSSTIQNGSGRRTVLMPAAAIASTSSWVSQSCQSILRYEELSEDREKNYARLWKAELAFVCPRYFDSDHSDCRQEEHAPLHIWPPIAFHRPGLILQKDPCEQKSMRSSEKTALPMALRLTSCRSVHVVIFLLLRAAASTHVHAIHLIHWNGVR